MSNFANGLYRTLLVLLFYERFIFRLHLFSKNGYDVFDMISRKDRGAFILNIRFIS